jgi:large subunit ribosomal protein L6
MVMAANIRETLPIPAGVTAVLEGGTLTVKGKAGTLTRTFKHPKITIQKTAKEVVIEVAFPRRREKALLGTWTAHVRNMYVGAQQGYEYTMKIVYSHFPIKTTVKDDLVVVDNFLGQKHPHTARIVGDTKVKVSGDQIVLSGPDCEQVGQTAANIEHATKIRQRDPKVFQDGIYITKKGGERNG